MVYSLSSQRSPQDERDFALSVEERTRIYSSEIAKGYSWWANARKDTHEELVRRAEAEGFEVLVNPRAIHYFNGTKCEDLTCVAILRRKRTDRGGR